MSGSGHESATSSDFSLRLFGSLEIRNGGLPVVLKTKKEKWLLALLALQSGREVEREWLAGVLWPDSEETSSRYNLRRELSALKAALGRENTCLQVRSSRSLRLDLEGGFCDVALFDAAIRRKDLSSLNQAIALYRGPLLQDCQEEWVHPERVQREQAYLAALEALASDALTRQAWGEAIQYSRLLVATDPLQETAHRTLMDALAQSGNHAAAAQVYRDLRLRLREELNADPDPLTGTLFERIRQEARRQAATPARPVKATCSITLDVAVSPSASSLPPIPRPITRLIGREEELAETLSLLRSSRLLTLAGAGGVGKTRLALEIAHSAAEDFADGVAFVDLAPLADPGPLPQTFAAALNIREETGVPLQTTLASSLQTRRILLIVDNCEHLLDATARLLHPLLQSCPRLCILATSRQSLGITGEILWRVPSLAVPPDLKQIAGSNRAKQDSSELLEYPAVQLFVERVRQAHPEFRLTPSNLPILSRICRQLDGIPLALELAAGRVRALSLEQIAERLQDRFKLLTGGSRAALPRQQTLRALIDWSYSLLEESEKRLLACLSIFAGGWTLEAAEAVCATQEMEAWEILDLLTSLVDRSLVVMEERSGTARYRMLETIHEYAREKLRDSEEREFIQTQHQQFFQQFARNLTRKLHTPQQAEWLKQLEAERENMRAALDFGLQVPEGGQAALQFAADLQQFWWMRGPLSEGRDYLKAALALPDAQEPSHPRALALNGAGVIAWMQADFAHAKTCYEASLEIRRALKDKPGISASLSNLGNLLRNQGEYEQARVCYEETLALDREAGDRNNIAISLLSLGNLAIVQGDIESARAYYFECLAIEEEVQDQRTLAMCLINLSILFIASGDFSAARPYGERSVNLQRSVGNSNGLALALGVWGRILAELGAIAQAKASFTECLTLCPALGDMHTTLFSLDSFAMYSRLAGRPQFAVRCLSATHALRKALGFPLEILDRAIMDGACAELQEALGTQTFETLWAEGAGLTLETLLEMAFAE